MGDLNSRHTNNTLNNLDGRILKTYIDNNSLQLSYTDSPTHYPINGQPPSTIDILVTKNNKQLINLYQLCELDSDHNPIVATLNELGTIGTNIATQ